MGLLDSAECSSGCESGWTVYFDQSASSPSKESEKRYKNKRAEEQELVESEEEEEDMSMVSDASSGPPHLHKEPCVCALKPYTVTRQAREVKQRKRGRSGEVEEFAMASILDDTASSSHTSLSQMIFAATNFDLPGDQTPSDNAVDFSQGFSATRSKERGALQEELGFFQFPASGLGYQENHISSMHR